MRFSWLKSESTDGLKRCTMKETKQELTSGPSRVWVTQELDQRKRESTARRLRLSSTNWQRRRTKCCTPPINVHWVFPKRDALSTLCRFVTSCFLKVCIAFYRLLISSCWSMHARNLTRTVTLFTESSRGGRPEAKQTGLAVELCHL